MNKMVLYSYDKRGLYSADSWYGHLMQCVCILRTGLGYFGAGRVSG